MITPEGTWTVDDMRAEWLDETALRCPDALLAIGTDDGLPPPFQTPPKAWLSFPHCTVFCVSISPD